MGTGRNAASVPFLYNLYVFSTKERIVLDKTDIMCYA